MRVELKLQIKVRGGRPQRVLVEGVQGTIDGPGRLRFRPIRPGVSPDDRLGKSQEVEMDEIEVLDTRYRTDGRTTLTRLFEVYDVLLDQGIAISYSGGGSLSFLLWIELADGQVALAEILPGKDGFPEWRVTVYASKAAADRLDPQPGRDTLTVRLTESAAEDAVLLCKRLHLVMGRDE